MERMISYEYWFQAEYCCCLQLVVTKILSVCESSKVASCNFILENYIIISAYSRLTRCGHYFHIACMDRWLRTHAQCPMCRSQVGIENRGSLGTNYMNITPRFRNLPGGLRRRIPVEQYSEFGSSGSDNNEELPVRCPSSDEEHISQADELYPEIDSREPENDEDFPYEDPTQSFSAHCTLGFLT